MFDFNLNFRKLVTDLLPPKHRKSIFTDWIVVLVSGVKTLHTSFTALVDEKRFDLRFNSQVIYLEYLLNLKFNGGLNGISIVDGNDIKQVYIWGRLENRNVYLRKRSEFQSERDVYLRKRSEFTSYSDFIVMVPASLNFNRSEMIALINRYKLAGKVFTINTY